MDSDPEIGDSVAMGGCAWIMVVSHMMNLVALAISTSLWKTDGQHQVLATIYTAGVLLLWLSGVLFAVIVWPGAVSRRWGVAIAAVYSVVPFVI